SGTTPVGALAPSGGAYLYFFKCKGGSSDISFERSNNFEHFRFFKIFLAQPQTKWRLENPLKIENF
ncbi:hypothetical protein, partial [Streptomyces narbonensis]|uniref:hypothetical protein n=1 Tax=Streptomyces narbonensis TaxID=67333 RepID=UPI001E5DB784